MQGFAADIMSIARVSFHRRLHEAGLSGLIINSVHDSIVVDTIPSDVDRIVEIFNNVFADLPANIKRIFGVEFKLPLRCEISVGPNQKELTEVK